MLLSIPAATSATRGGALQVHQLLELEAVAGGAAGEPDSAGKHQPAAEVDGAHATSAPGSSRSASQSTLSIGMTGPSLQHSAQCDVPPGPRAGSAQPRHVPKPQPIGASSEASISVPLLPSSARTTDSA